jgi:hypothetical protein
MKQKYFFPLGEGEFAVNGNVRIELRVPSLRVGLGEKKLCTPNRNKYLKKVEKIKKIS